MVHFRITGTRPKGIVQEIEELGASIDPERQLEPSNLNRAPANDMATQT